MSSAGTGTASKSRTNLARSLFDSEDSTPGVFALLPAVLPTLLLPSMSTDMLCWLMCSCISAAALFSTAAILSGLPSGGSTLSCMVLPAADAVPPGAMVVASSSDRPDAMRALCIAASRGSTGAGGGSSPSSFACTEVLMKKAPSVSELRTHWRLAVRMVSRRPPVLRTQGKDSSRTRYCRQMVRVTSDMLAEVTQHLCKRSAACYRLLSFQIPTVRESYFRQQAGQLTKTRLSVAAAATPCTYCWAQSSAHWCQPQTGGGSLGCPRSQRLQHGPKHDSTLITQYQGPVLPPCLCTWLRHMLSTCLACKEAERMPVHAQW